ncbi:hypothetical protein QQZ08_011498 [Neonectria magnoliae]|uniref:DUF6987 domain-containing protein n=1 Tax=Neonectria magnoliae TaxID=2732573 RepID=A0ABR1HA48_9HYPO
MQKSQNQSIPGGWNKDTPKDTPAEEQSNPSTSSVPSPYLALIIPVAVESQSVPRSGVGVVSETGDIVDDAGKSVGKISGSNDPKELIGNTVTEAGDIVSDTGDVLGKAVPHDEESSEYTTDAADKKKSGGFGSGLKSAVGETLKPATSRLPGGSKSGSSNAPEDNSVTPGEETEETEKTEQTEKQVEDTKDEKASDINLKDQEGSQTESKVQETSQISLEDKDPSTTAKDAEVEDKDLSTAAKDAQVEPKDELSEVPPDAEEEGKEGTVSNTEIKPDDSVSRFNPADTNEEQKDTPRTESLRSVPPQPIPESETAKEDIPKSDVYKSEVNKSDIPEGSELEKQESKVPESELPKTDTPGTEVPKTDAGETQVPKSDVAKSQVPEGSEFTKKTDVAESEVPKSDVAQSQVPEGSQFTKKSDVGESEVSKSQAPPSELPEGEVPEGEVPKSEVPESQVARSEVPEGDVPEGETPGTEVPKSDLQSEAPKSVASEDEVKDTKGLEGEPPVNEEDAEAEDEEKIDYSVLEGCTVNKGGNLINDKGELIGRIVEGELKKLVGKKADENGNIWTDAGKAIGKAEPLPDSEREDLKDFAPFENFPGATIEGDGRVMFEGKQVGQVVDGDPKRLKGSKVDEDGDILDRKGNVIGKAEAWDEPEEVPEEEVKVDNSALKGCKVNKGGNLINDKGELVGRVVEGDLKKLIGKKADENGDIWNDEGKVIGKAEVIPDTEREEAKESPFENFPGAVVEGDGRVLYEGRQVGQVVDGDPKKLKGSKVDEDGDIIDRNGNVIGKAEAWDEPEEVPEEEVKVDNSSLKGCKVNKAGNLINNHGDVMGRVIEGDLKELIGKRSDENGDIWSDAGKVIGKGETVSDAERDELKDTPFENFPGALAEADGRVMYEGRQVGVVVEGDPKKLKGSKVDEDGDILDRRGNTIGRAEAWDEPEPEPEEEVDNSALAGKRVNKAGNVVGSNGEIFGRVIEGHIGSLIGRMCDKNGNIMSESGEIIGKAELVPLGQREGTRDGPFADMVGCTVAKDGKVVTPSGDVVGRLTSGDPKVLFGRAVDEDGDILDKNGNVIGKAERWEEEEVEKKKDFLAGRRVNREGNVVDEDGNIIGKLTSGELLVCSGKEVDEDGDVVNQKGQTIGHVTRLEDIPPEPEPEPEVETESPEEKEKRETAEKDRKLAGQLAACVEQALDKVRPICKLITDKIDTAERTPKEELDEEELVKQVRPLIEEGGKILSEANGSIRGLDPDGRIQRNAKHKSGTREASPEEFHLADCLKELTGTVSQTIDNAKRKIDGMPHAKKELNPLWGLLAEPLGQILAAVGLLLSGVLGIVGRLLSGLGLGGLIDGLLGGLGLDKILKGLGLGSVVSSLTGKKK